VSLEELREQAEASRPHRRTPNHLVHVSELVDRLRFEALARKVADEVSTLLHRAVTDGTRLNTVLREPELCIAAGVGKPDLRPELIPLSLGPQGGHRFSLRPTR
jgi:hypothetical protein